MLQQGDAWLGRLLYRLCCGGASSPRLSASMLVDQMVKAGGPECAPQDAVALLVRHGVAVDVFEDGAVVVKCQC